MASEGTSYDYDDNCIPCQGGYHSPPHEYPVEPVPECLQGVHVLVVRPADVLVISDLDWDAREVTDEQYAVMKRLFGVREVMLLSGPAKFSVIRSEES